MVDGEGPVRRLVGEPAPAQHRARLERQCLDRRHAVEDLEQEGLAAALDLVELVQLTAEGARHQRQDRKGDRRHGEHDQGQPPRIDQQHRHKNNEGEKIEDGIEEAAREEIADVVGLPELVGGDPRRIGMEIVDRQLQEVLDRAVGDLMIEPARDKGQEVLRR